MRGSSLPRWCRQRRTQPLSSVSPSEFFLPPAVRQFGREIGQVPPVAEQPSARERNRNEARTLLTMLPVHAAPEVAAAVRSAGGHKRSSGPGADLTSRLSAIGRCPQRAAADRRSGRVPAIAARLALAMLSRSGRIFARRSDHVDAVSDAATSTGTTSGGRAHFDKRGQALGSPCQSSAIRPSAQLSARPR